MKTKNTKHGRRRRQTRRLRRQRQTRRQHGGVPEIPVGARVSMHVNHLGFTQETISPTFTNASQPNMRDWIHTVSTKNPEKNRFDLDILIHRLGFPRDMFPLEVVYHNGEYYSCNNRRLCLLKSLTKFGFDGMVPCVRVSECRHATHYTTNVRIMPSGGTCSMDGIRDIEREEAIFSSGSNKDVRVARASAAAAAADAAEKKRLAEQQKYGKAQPSSQMPNMFD
jgi:hypothetical protein